jgi:hypothetical protein
MACICPPGTKSDQRLDVVEIVKTRIIEVEAPEEGSYHRGIDIEVLDFPEWGGKRFNYDTDVTLERLYDVGFISFSTSKDYFLPEMELMWNRNYYYLPEGTSQIYIWLYPEVTVDLRYDIWECPEDEPTPPGSGGDNPGTGGDNPGSGGDNPGSGGDDTGSGGDAPGTGG